MGTRSAQASRPLDAELTGARRVRWPLPDRLIWGNEPLPQPVVRFRPIGEHDLSRPDIAEFSCGDDPWQVKVATFLRSGRAWEVHQTGESETLIFEDTVGGEVVGFANVFPDVKSWPKWNGKRRMPCLHIAWIAVAARHQGRGYGREIIEELAARAIEADQSGLYLLVDTRNEDAIRFYARLGFREFGGANLYRDDEDGSENLRLFLPLFAE